MSAREPNRVFRESFLAYEFEGERYETMRRFGEILSELAGESSLHPRFIRPIIYPELEAVAVDLTRAAEYLEEASRDADSEDAAQVKLAGAALGWADQLRAVEAEIRAALGIESVVEAAEVGFESAAPAGAAPAGAAGDLTVEEARPHLAALGRFLSALGVSLGELAARLGRKAREDE